MTKEILLTRQKVALVDDEDFERLNLCMWQAHKCFKTFYAIRSTTLNRKRIDMKMHRCIVNIPEGYECDHIDGDGLNNQKSNLRIVTHRQNMQNIHCRKKSSKYLGVCWRERDKRWRASIEINGRGIHLGNFKSEIAAFNKYKLACEILSQMEPAS
jgi:hypothetical protein